MQPTDRDFALAKIFLTHSVKVKLKEKVLISLSDEVGLRLGKAVYIEALKLGAWPMVDFDLANFQGRSNIGGLNYQFFKLANDWQLNYFPKEVVQSKVAWADAFIRIVTQDNPRELSGIPSKKLTVRSKQMMPILDPMIDKNRWVLTYYPTQSMAIDAGMSYDELVEFYYDACIVDYGKMERELKALEKLMDEGSEIHVVGKMTDLHVNIKGRLAEACYGEANVPDGECFLAPVTDGVEGEVYFDMPTLANGRVVSEIHLRFEKGKVVQASAEQGDEALQAMLATDDGARYLGEFAVGANYHVTRAMLNTLFDEKIGGTIHMALGRAYKSERGGGENESSIHWDIVKDMRLSGSTLTIDGTVVLQDGRLLV